MGGEVFIYPILIVTVVMVSVILAEVLRKLLAVKSMPVVLLAVALVAPTIMFLIALQDPKMVWAYVMFSVGLSAIASCSVAVYYALFRLPR